MKLCPHCGKRLIKNQHCSCSSAFLRHNQYNATRRDKSKNDFYHSKDWRAITMAIKARANGLDEYALSQGRIVAGNTVHHIYTIDERPDLQLSLDNLIYVSASTHNWIHSEYNRDDDVRCELQTKLKNLVAGGVLKSLDS